MADSYIQVALDGPGKRMQTVENLVSGNSVHAEAVLLVDQFGVPLATVPVSGPLTDAELRATPVPVIGSFTVGEIEIKNDAGNPVPVSAAALPLPTGAATEAKQDTQITDLGGVTETAPASDTALSGLNGRLQRIAQRLTSLIALLPVSLGGKTAAGSLSVTTATDDPELTLIGSVTETAPASDTASSGINGRLQRIAQRITSLIALLPASIGQKAKAASLAVALPTDQVGTALIPSSDILSVQRPAITEVRSTSLESSHVLKASAGQLVQLSVFNSGVAQFILLINATTLPANGAVTLLFPPIPIAKETILVLDLPAPLVASTGIVVCNSSTGSFVKTIGAADLAIYAQVN